jgi:hypothetical protein
MANVKISNLPVAATVDGASSVPVVEGGVTKQVTFTGMLTSPALFASGMAAFFATPSSANLRAALTDETGTGAAVFADSPTLTGAVSVTGTVAATKLIPTGNVTAGNGMYLPATNTLAWSTNSTERARITSTGLVGIGTSSPAASLDVNGGVRAIQGLPTGDASNVGFSFGPDGDTGLFSPTTGGAASGVLVFYGNAVEVARFDGGSFITSVNNTAPTLSTNSTMSFELTSNTSLKIVVRGTDGVTRSVSLTLA